MANCHKKSKNKLFVFKEQRSQLTLRNEDEVESVSIHVYGCEINDEGIRCDHLHIAKQVEMYIELKGQDLLHAMKQIERTISLLGSKNLEQQRISYIICSRSPLASTEIQSYDRKFRAKFNSKLIIKSSPYVDRY